MKPMHNDVTVLISFVANEFSKEAWFLVHWFCSPFHLLFPPKNEHHDKWEHLRECYEGMSHAVTLWLNVIPFRRGSPIGFNYSKSIVNSDFFIHSSFAPIMIWRVYWDFFSFFVIPLGGNVYLTFIVIMKILKIFTSEPNVRLIFVFSDTVIVTIHRLMLRFVSPLLPYLIWWFRQHNLMLSLHMRYWSSMRSI